MSYIPDPPTKAVIKQCCTKTCGTHLKSDLSQILSQHKVEFGLSLFVVIWIITNSVLFAVAANGECGDETKRLWLIFGGLTFCLPATIGLAFLTLFLSMYFRQMWGMAQYETQQIVAPDLSESWLQNKSYILPPHNPSGSVIIHMYENEL